MSKLFQVISEFFAGLGRSMFFLFSVLVSLPKSLLKPGLITRQLYMLGVLSLIIIVISGVFIGMVLALQGYRTLSRFGALSGSIFRPSILAFTSSARALS